MLKAFHRAFQMKGDMGKFCKYDSPTLIVSDGGQKLPVHQKSLYTNDKVVNVSSFSQNSRKKYDFPKIEEKKSENSNNLSKFQLPDPYTMLERDDDVTICRCGKKFNFFIRKHHCRYILFFIFLFFYFLFFYFIFYFLFFYFYFI